MRNRTVCSIVAAGVLAAPAAASAAFMHTVTAGESLSSIAAADGLSVAQVAGANGLPADAQLVAGSTVAIPPQDASASASPSSSVGGAVSVSSPSASTVGSDSDGDNDGSAGTASGGVSTASASPSAGSTTTGSGGSYVVQPGDTLTAIAARAGTSVASLAAANGLDPGGVLLSGTALQLSSSGTTSSGTTSAATLAPAVGASVTGRMTWFGGPNDSGAQGAPASGLGWRSDGMSFYNYGSLGHRWQIHFPWGQTLNMTQIDIGPAPWTGNPFDIAFSALPNTPYSSSSWPNPVVTGTYLGQ
jgi:LysM repeat protein